MAIEYVQDLLVKQEVRKAGLVEIVSETQVNDINSGSDEDNEVNNFDNFKLNKFYIGPAI